jgi:ferric-dicitrate binding protein FerR (iron transport regulator)
MVDPTPHNPVDRFAMLVARYFDGDLDSAETAELNAYLRSDADRRREFADYGTQVARLRELAAAASAGPVPRTGENTEPPTPARRRDRRRVAIFATVAAIAAMIVVAAIIVFIPRPVVQAPHSPPVVASVEPASGDVRIVAADGQVRAASDEIRDGDTVRIEGSQSAAAISYSDGTRLALIGETAVTCSERGGKVVRLHHGTVAASVRQQPLDEPMVVETPTARVEVIGTEFTCQASADRTEVSVTRGRVRVVRMSDATAVEVADGQRVLATAQAALAVEPVQKRTETWDLNFESGLPVGLHRGRFISEGLPPGSKGGVAAVPAVVRAGEDLFEIASPEMWHQGLFTFHADSHLHVTYKMERPGWTNVFVCARGPDANGPHIGNYLFNNDGFSRDLRPGQWRTASVPLATLRRAGMRDDKPPAADEVPYLILFSSQGDRGLVIDRMWVTRGGPGTTQFRDLD